MITRSRRPWSPTCRNDVRLARDVTNYFFNLCADEYFQGITPVSKVTDDACDEFSTLRKLLQVWLDNIDDSMYKGNGFRPSTPSCFLSFFELDLPAMGRYLDLEPSKYHKSIHPGVMMFMKDILSWYDSLNQDRDAG